jgi:poly-gamma-glutamate synthesis protein (capsule biosynthesis protein)
MRIVVVCLIALTDCSRAQAQASKNARDVVRLIFVGDIMLDTMPGEVIENDHDPFAHVAKVLADADFTIGNLECVVAVGGEKFDKKFNFRAHPRVVPFLKKHFDALSLANNHTGDYGDAALLEELQLLKEAGIRHFGAGRNIDDARRPLVLESKGIRIALLGYNEFKPRAFEAEANSPGIAWSVDDDVVADIRKAKQEAGADLVIPYMHWGPEEELTPSARQRQFSKVMIEAGADAVVGAHPHVIQGYGTHRDKPIFCSLGNFVFDGFAAEATTTGWILHLTVGKRGVVQWDVTTIALDEQGVPHLAMKKWLPVKHN